MKKYGGKSILMQKRCFNRGRRKVNNMTMGARRNLLFALLQVGLCSRAQTVSPVIAEYKTMAEGRIALTNNTFASLAVVLEPRSFSVTPNGIGVYRPLDPTIHVELSSK